MLRAKPRAAHTPRGGVRHPCRDRSIFRCVRRRFAGVLVLFAMAALAVCTTALGAATPFNTDWSTAGANDATSALDAPLSDQPVFEGPVPRATCDAGSLAETAVQGEVPLKDRQDGRDKLGYRCNMQLVGQYQGQGTTWVSQSYEHCAYFAQAFPSSLHDDHPGVRVV